MTPVIRGQEDTLLPIKELYYEISKVAKSVEGLNLGPDPSLVEKTKKVLEEYLPLDISSGLPEQNELLELRDKADDVKTSEETRKAVMDGLEVLGNVDTIKSDGSQLGKIVDQEMDKIEKRIGVNIDFSQGDIRHTVEQFRLSINFMSNFPDSIVESLDGDIHPIDEVRFLRKLGYEFLEEHYDGYFKEVESIGIRPLSFDFLEKMKNEIALGKKSVETIGELKDLPHQILSSKEEIKVIEELRDNGTVEKILKLLEKLKKSFESMKGLLGLENLEWRITYFTQKLAPIQNYLKNLKIAPGDLTDPIKKIESCLVDYDFSMDFSDEEAEFKKTEMVIKKVQKLEAEYEDFWRLPTKYRKICQKMITELKTWEDMNPREDYDTKLSDSGAKSLLKILDIVNKTEIDQMFHTMEPKKEFPPEILLQNISTSLKELDIQAIKYLISGIPAKFSQINTFLNCYSSLKIVPSEVKSLMDQPKEVWNFDSRQLEYAVEIVYLFKQAHRFLAELKQPEVTKEDVTGITDGLKVLKAILDFQTFWIKNSDQHPSITLEVPTNISDILIPSDPNLDALINFYSTQYQGGQRTRILKALKGVKNSSSFAVKLEKMNEVVTKIGDLDPGSKDPEEPEFIDCFESTCPVPIPLLEGNPPEAPVKEKVI